MTREAFPPPFILAYIYRAWTYQPSKVVSLNTYLPPSILGRNHFPYCYPTTSMSAQDGTPEVGEYTFTLFYGIPQDVRKSGD
jgi:hypothetical protein